MKIFVVLSRNTDFIYCTTDSDLAIQIMEYQQSKEEIGEGRPSVYIKTTTLH
jgi:hypothetical protein